MNAILCSLAHNKCLFLLTISSLLLPTTQQPSMAVRELVFIHIEMLTNRRDMSETLNFFPLNEEKHNKNGKVKENDNDDTN